MVLNEIMTMEFEANITFGLTKLKLLQRIYNWIVSYPKRIIYLALADMCACFRFPQLQAHVTGAVGFVAQKMYLLARSMVFGSNTSASSWEPFCRALAALILEYSMRSDLIKKHKNLLDMLVWEDDNIDVTDMVQATKCPLNPGIPDLDGTLQTYTNVDDILASAVNKQNTLRLLATIIEAMFTVCGRINIKVRQCP